MIKPIDPNELLGTYTDELDSRFNGLDGNIRDRMMKDMRAEDKALKPLIESSRLAYWHQAAIDRAKQDEEFETSEKTKAGAGMSDIARELDEVEEKIKGELNTKAVDMLHAKPKGKGKRRGSTNMGSLRGLMKGN